MSETQPSMSEKTNKLFSHLKHERKEHTIHFGLPNIIKKYYFKIIVDLYVKMLSK